MLCLRAPVPLSLARGTCLSGAKHFPAAQIPVAVQGRIGARTIVDEELPAVAEAVAIRIRVEDVGADQLLEAVDQTIAIAVGVLEGVGDYLREAGRSETGTATSPQQHSSPNAQRRHQCKESAPSESRNLSHRLATGFERSDVAGGVSCDLR